MGLALEMERKMRGLAWEVERRRREQCPLINAKCLVRNLVNEKLKTAEPHSGQSTHGYQGLLTILASLCPLIWVRV